MCFAIPHNALYFKGVVVEAAEKTSEEVMMKHPQPRTETHPSIAVTLKETFVIVYPQTHL